MLLVLARLDDWETDSHAGYISSISQHGSLLTYGNYYKSFINDTVAESNDILYDGTTIDNILTAVYDGVQVTYSNATGQISVWQYFTWINDDDVEETIWQETGTVLTARGTTELFIYRDTVAYIRTSDVQVYQLLREENSYGESVVTGDARFIG